MRISCSYSKNMDKFLKRVVDYTVDNYAFDLDISALKSIQLIPSSQLPYPTDGKTCNRGTEILVTSRLYELLPSHEIDQLSDNMNFKCIVNTLYHEMGHVNDWKKMPGLYVAVERADNIKHAWPALFWLEYISEKRSCSTNLVSYAVFCNSFVRREWKSNQFNLQFANEENFFYLTKVLSYFMARTINHCDRNAYLEVCKNELLKQLIADLDAEISKLEKLSLFDDPDKLEPLYKILDNYLSEFCKRFA